MRRRTEIKDGTWKSPHERRDARRKALGPLANGPSATLGDFARAWLEERTPHLTKPVQYDYKLLLDSHVLGHGIARQPIAKVNDADIARVIKDISEREGRRGKPLSPRRIKTW